MITDRDMRVFQTEFDFIDKGDTDWRLSLEHATFIHKEACEFIFYVGVDKDSYDAMIKKYAELGFSEDFIKACKKAYTLHYNYTCLYA